MNRGLPIYQDVETPCGLSAEPTRTSFAEHRLRKVQAQFIDTGFERDIVAKTALPPAAEKFLFSCTEDQVLRARKNCAGVEMLIPRPNPSRIVDVFSLGEARKDANRVSIDGVCQLEGKSI